MMETLTLYWSDPLRFWDLDKEEWPDEFYERGIYLVAGAGRIIYIGQTYDQNFGRRLWQHVNSSKWDCINRQMRNTRAANPMIKCGFLEDIHSRSRIDDIETLLIWAEDPPCNKRSRIDCRDFKLENIGNPWPLKSAYYAEDY